MNITPTFIKSILFTKVYKSNLYAYQYKIPHKDHWYYLTRTLEPLENYWRLLITMHSTNDDILKAEQRHIVSTQSQLINVLHAYDLCKLSIDAQLYARAYCGKIDKFKMVK